MISLQPVVDRLIAAGCERVQGLIEYVAQTSAPAQLPAHFVAPLDEDATPNRLSGVIDQRVALRFQVVLVIAGVAARPQAPSEDLTRLETRLRKALVGWTIPGASMPTEYAGGRLLSAGGRELTWGARFRTAYHERTSGQ